MILGMILPSLVFPSVAKAATKTYISDLYFSSDKHNKGDCVKDLVASGVPSGNVVDHDFNCDAGGKYIYLGYKTTTDVNKAIRGLIFSGQKKDSITYNGVKYYPITNTSKDGTLDFNQDAKGDDIFLYYSKDKEAGLPITSLGAYCSEHKYAGNSTNVKVRNEKGSVQDTNYASGGNYVSLTYKYDEDSIDKSTKKTNYKVYDDPNKVPLALTLCRDWLESNRIVRDWVEVANAINTKNAVEYEGGDSYRMQVGSLININNP